MGDDPARVPEWLDTADGERLEARWCGADGARAVAVLTHPHPRFGGDMDNIVPASLSRSLPAEGITTLRFNFRGTGRSSGTHGGGAAEVVDVRAAVDAVSDAHPGLPVVGVGYSFGADVLLATDDDRLAALVAVAPPLAVLPAGQLTAPRGGAPTLVLAAEHDQFRSAAETEALVADWPDTTFDVVHGADHFLAGMTAEVADRVLAFLAPTLP